MAKADFVKSDCRSLRDKIEGPGLENWQNASDKGIEDGMKNLKPWSEAMEKIVKMMREAELLLTGKGIDPRSRPPRMS